MVSYGWFWNNTRAISLNFNPFSAVNTLGIGRVSFGFVSFPFYLLPGNTTYYQRTNHRSSNVLQHLQPPPTRTPMQSLPHCVQQTKPLPLGSHLR